MLKCNFIFPGSQSHYDFSGKHSAAISAILQLLRIDYSYTHILYCMFTVYIDVSTAMFCVYTGVYTAMFCVYTGVYTAVCSVFMLNVQLYQ